jgi:hypothetical protein
MGPAMGGGGDSMQTIHTGGGHDVADAPDAAHAPAGTAMRVQATEEAVRFIRERGGELYVWADLVRSPGCCAVPFLTAATERPADGVAFTRFAGPGFDLYYHDGGLERPGRLVLELRGRRRPRILARTPDFWLEG